MGSRLRERQQGVTLKIFGVWATGPRVAVEKQPVLAIIF
jgi:hypothetical protein